MKIMSNNLVNTVTEIVKPKVVSLGYDFWGMECHLQGKYSTLRIYIEHPEKKINLEDCSLVSEQVSALLDVADCITYSYSLEISSPGLNRLLFHPEHYRRFIGSKVQLRLSQPLENRRNYVGVVQKVEDDLITILSEGQTITLVCDKIEKANLINEA